MSEQLIQLQDLQAQLHEVNQELVRAAQPLERLSDMKETERQQLAGSIRAALARWELLTRQISQVLRGDVANGTQRSVGDSNQS